MSQVNWREILGWGDEQLEELRFAGFSFLREGLYPKALLFFEALVVLDPKSAYDHQTLGALYLQMENGPKAIATLEKAIELDSSHEPSLLNLSKALLMSHRIQEAMEIIERLSKSEDPTIANDAAALTFAYR